MWTCTFFYTVFCIDVARFLIIVYKSSHKKLFSISNHNFKHHCRITWNWQLFNHFCLPHFGLRQITNTLEMTHRVLQCSVCCPSLGQVHSIDLLTPNIRSSSLYLYKNVIYDGLIPQSLVNCLQHYHISYIRFHEVLIRFIASKVRILLKGIKSLLNFRNVAGSLLLMVCC